MRDCFLEHTIKYLHNSARLLILPNQKKVSQKKVKLSLLNGKEIYQNMRSKKPAMNVKKTALGPYSASQPCVDAKKAPVSHPSRFLCIQTIFLQLFKNRKKFVIPFPI